VGLGQDFGEQRDPDHQFGAGAEPGDKSVDRKVENALREALQCGENAVEGNAEGERAHPADIVGEDAEQKPAESPTQQPGHAEEAAIFADIGQWRIAAEQFRHCRLQHQRVQPEIGGVERPADGGLWKTSRRDHL